MQHIRKNDLVVLRKTVTACRSTADAHENEEERSKWSKWATHHGDKARVLDVDPGTRRVIVEGVNYRYKHIRPDRDNPRGGRVLKEVAIDISNVQPYCEKCDRGVRIKSVRNDDGKRVRTCARCGEIIGTA